nr:interleukin-13 isoform X1 [Gorilla gorilla gorilla]
MVSGVTTWAYKSCHKTPRPQATQPIHPLLNPLLLALGLMALFLTTVIALTCLGSFASPGPVPPSTALRELIEELVNITQNQKAPLCNGSMVWSINLTAGVYCAALESLINVSGCSAIEKTQRMLSGFCPHKVSAGVRRPPPSHAHPAPPPANPGLTEGKLAEYPWCVSTQGWGHCGSRDVAFGIYRIWAQGLLTPTWASISTSVQ